MSITKNSPRYTRTHNDKKNTNACQTNTKKRVFEAKNVLGATSFDSVSIVDAKFQGALRRWPESKDITCDFAVVKIHSEFKNDEIEVVSQEENDRLKLLHDAASKTLFAKNPIEEMLKGVFEDTVNLLGRESILRRNIRNEHELIEAILIGFPSEVLVKLSENKIPQKFMEQIIAPHRTLMRRRSENKRLTKSESDAVWRLSYIYTLAGVVFGSHKTVVDWMVRPKNIFGNNSALDLLETSIGTNYVEQLLIGLDWGHSS